MGFTPQDVDQMSIWEWSAAINGYVDAHSPKGGNTLSEDEKEALFTWVEVGADGPRTISTQTYLWDGLRLVPGGPSTFTVG